MITAKLKYVGDAKIVIGSSTLAESEFQLANHYNMVSIDILTVIKLINEFKSKFAKNVCSDERHMLDKIEHYVRSIGAQHNNEGIEINRIDYLPIKFE